jgi:hypothetical protein
MVADEIKNYTKEHPYDLRWRFEFDETLRSVCNINGYQYDPDNLSEMELKKIQKMFGYLRSLKDFLEEGILWKDQTTALLKADPKCTYIDYVYQGWANDDKETFSFKQFWETSDGTTALDNEGTNALLSSESLFDFDDFIHGVCGGDYYFCTQVLENGKVTTDWKTYYKPKQLDKDKNEDARVKLMYGVKITYSWGDEEPVICVGSKEDAWKKAKQLAVDEAEIVSVEDTSPVVELSFNKERTRITLHYVSDNEYCYYDVVELDEWYVKHLMV